MYARMLKKLESLQEDIEDCAEARTDVEALSRVMLARLLGRAVVILRALAADETSEKEK